MVKREPRKSEKRGQHPGFERGRVSQLQGEPVRTAAAGTESILRTVGRGLETQWEGPRVDYPDVPIHRHFETWAAQQPGVTAVVFEEEDLDYDELNRRANQLAHYLIAAGVTAEVRVAVCLAPSLAVPVSLLAILKAGGAYVPLDPGNPVERIASILEDCRPHLIIIQSESLPKLSALSGARFFCFDQEFEQIQRLSMQNPTTEINPKQTAYLIYTSGTTGKPKGVLVSHYNLIHYIISAKNLYGFNAGDVILAVARFTFSISLFELLSPLVAGGRLFLLARDRILNLKYLVAVLRKVTVVHASPSLWRRILSHVLASQRDDHTFPNIRHASSGGDMVPAELQETMKGIFPKADTFVIYGCTEISCMGCSYPVPRDQEVKKTLVGKPFSNMTVRLLDEAQQPVSPGNQGEIYFGGAGVATGYLNLSEITGEKFVTLDGSRFYRTGDLGRFIDGDLQISGRADFQIQLRGIRIEPGEIEARLRDVPGIREAVVVARELGSSEKSLVAYMVFEENEKPGVELIRTFLKERLPDYMQPAAFVVLAALPLNANLKIDRRALPAPVPGNMAGLGTVVFPRDGLEKHLVEIWESALGTGPIGINNSFFELGGDSLQAIQILLQIEERWNKTLPITSLVEAPSLGALADLVRHSESSKASQEGKALGNIVPLRTGGNRPPLFCLHGVILYQELAKCLDGDQPVYAVFLQEEVELLKTRKYDPVSSDFSTIPGIARHYLESLRTTQPHGPYYLAGASFGGLIAFEMGQQLRAAGEEVALIALFDSWMIKKIPLHRRVAFHLDWLSEHGLGYLFNRAQHRLERFARRLTIAGSKMSRQVRPMSKSTTQIVSLQDLERLLDEVAAEVEHSYRPRTYPGKVILFRATEQGSLSKGSLDLGWKRLCIGDFSVFDIPGDHKGILEGVPASILATYLQPHLQ